MKKHDEKTKNSNEWKGDWSMMKPHIRMSFLWISGLVGILLSCSSVGWAKNMDIDERINRLEKQLEQLQNQIHQSRAVDLNSVEERVEKLERKEPSFLGGETGNMVFFRAGGAFATSNRSNEVFTDTFGANGSNNDSDKGYYVGAGLDLVMSKNIWGMLPGTWVLGEIGVEFKRFNSNRVIQAVPFVAGVTRKKRVNITMLTVDIAPKIMFMEGSRFRPWIIPVGLDFHVISPPSNSSTVLDIGAQFGVGAQYRIWKAFHLGIDGRFHVTADQTDTTNHFGTVGAYVGIAF